MYAFAEELYIAYPGMDFVNEIKEAPEKGKIYAISNFNVADSKPNYSAVRNRFFLRFLKNTCMQLINKDDTMIQNTNLSWLLLIL